MHHYDVLAGFIRKTKAAWGQYDPTEAASLGVDRLTSGAKMAFLEETASD
jgi:hypothetical protein